MQQAMGIYHGIKSAQNILIVLYLESVYISRNMSSKKLNCRWIMLNFALGYQRDIISTGRQIWWKTQL